VPLTVAVNCFCWPSSTVGADGAMLTEIAGTVMVTEADWLGSVAEVALMLTVKLLVGAVVGAV
jgi:hypothetical protein